MFCTKCGAQNDDGGNFCGKCGAKLTKITYTGQQQSAGAVEPNVEADDIYFDKILSFSTKTQKILNAHIIDDKIHKRKKRGDEIWKIAAIHRFIIISMILMM